MGVLIEQTCKYSVCVDKVHLKEIRRERFQHRMFTVVLSILVVSTWVCVSVFMYIFCFFTHIIFLYSYIHIYLCVCINSLTTF